MKRPSLKFDKEAILEFLFAHCEKFVMAVAGLGMLAFLWAGFNAVRLESVKPEQTPESLKDLTATVNKHIAAAAKPPATKTRVGGKLAPAIDPWRPQQIKIAPPPRMAVLDRPLFQQKAKRAKPDVYPIEDLRATAGIAVFPAPAVEPQPGAAQVGIEEPVNGDDGKGKGKGKGKKTLSTMQGTPSKEKPQEVKLPPGRIVPYVVVTGLVPVTKQRAEFDRSFSSASLRDPQTDTPRWCRYLVERFEEGSDSAKWDRLTVANVEFDQRGDPAARPAEPVQQEILPAQFLLGATEAEVGYAAPVPQRIDDAWGLATVHPWFHPELERLLEENRLGAVADKPAKPIDAEKVEKDPLKLVGDHLIIEGMEFVDDQGDTQPTIGLKALTVRAKENGEPAFPAGEIGKERRMVFAVSTAWAQALELEKGISSNVGCNLRVRIEQFGDTPVARILGIRYLNADGRAGEELADPNPRPLAGNVPGGMPQAGGPVAGAEFRLFRFVDTSVTPGKRYRYRVKLALRNPNFGLDQQFLVDATAARGEFLLSTESAATSPVMVPEPTVILARPLTKDEAKEIEMKIKPGSYEVLVLGKSEGTGNYALRGILTEIGGLADVAEMNKTGDDRHWGEVISTGRILLDVHGRQEKAGSPARPAGPADPFEMLFYDPAKKSFEFVSAADSERQFNQYKSTLPKKPNPSPDDLRPPKKPNPPPNELPPK